MSGGRTMGIGHTSDAVPLIYAIVERNDASIRLAPLIKPLFPSLYGSLS